MSVSSKIKDGDKTKISLHKHTEMMDEINKQKVLNAELNLQQRKGTTDDKAAKTRAWTIKPAQKPPKE